MSPPPARARGRPVDLQARAERRGQILAAAQRCFARKGFHATTTAELCAEAEISVAGLYQYFPSKEELIRALIELDLSEGVTLIEQLSASATFIDDLEALARLAAEDSRLSTFSRLRLEILAEASRSPDVAEMVAAADDRFVDTLVRALTRAQASGQLRRAADVHETAAAIVCIMDGLNGRLAIPAGRRGPYLDACSRLVRSAIAPT